MNTALSNSGTLDAQQKSFIQLNELHQLPNNNLRYEQNHKQSFKQPNRQLASGDKLYLANQEASFIYLINQGFVKTVVHSAMGSDRIIDVYGPGEIIGTAALEATVHAETAQALTTASLTPIDPDYALVDLGNTAFSKYLSTTLAKQIARHREAINDANLPVGARLCKQLIRLSKRFGEATNQDHIRLPFSLTQEEYAAALGSSRITVSRVFTNLRSTGAVIGKANKRSGFVLDCERLEHTLDTYILDIL